MSCDVAPVDSRVLAAMDDGGDCKGLPSFREFLESEKSRGALDRMLRDMVACPDDELQELCDFLEDTHSPSSIERGSLLHVSVVMAIALLCEVLQRRKARQ